MDAKVFERESKTNNEHTVTVLCQRHGFILLYHFIVFFCFLTRNLNQFCSYFYYCNWPENFHHHTYSRHHANNEWLIFPTTTLIPGNTSVREGRVRCLLVLIQSRYAFVWNTHFHHQDHLDFVKHLINVYLLKKAYPMEI